jgi:exosortase/archaeosortase family protein
MPTVGNCPPQHQGWAVPTLDAYLILLNQTSMKLAAAGNLGQRLWQRAMRDRHSQIVTVGLLFLLAYLPGYLGYIVHGIIEGRSDSILNFGFLYLGLQAIHQHRAQLKTFEARSDDRFLGYGLMLIGIVAFGFYHSITYSISFQALAVILIVLGIAASSWGLAFFPRFLAATGFVLFSIYPSTSFIAIQVCRFFTSENMLENVMAWLGSLGLNAIGYKSISDTLYVKLPEGAVLVGPGCSGFDMAYTILGCSLLCGLFLKMSWPKTILMMGVGWVLAMVCNVPRIMLLAIASVYWGKSSFEFWHGPIGGQLFSGVMFTLYYYIVMAIINSGGGKPGLPSQSSD